MATLIQYRVTQKHFGPERPGAPHKIHNIGAFIWAPAEGKGALPPKQDYAVPVDAPKAKPVASEAVLAAQARVKKARTALGKADQKGDAEKVAAAQAELTEAEAEEQAAIEADAAAAE